MILWDSVYASDSVKMADFARFSWMIKDFGMSSRLWNLRARAMIFEDRVSLEFFPVPKMVAN